jgi:hypothetical protein
MRSIADTFHPTEDEMHVRNDVILVPPNPANEVKP